MNEPGQPKVGSEGKRWPDGEEVWVCRGCCRVGTSARHLLEQGCEGRPEQVLPASEAERLRKAIEAVLQLSAAESGAFDGEDVQAVIRMALRPDEEQS